MNNKKKIVVIILTIALFVIFSAATVIILSVTDKNVAAPDKTVEQQKIDKLLDESVKAAAKESLESDTESMKNSKQEIDQQATIESGTINNSIVNVSE